MKDAEFQFKGKEIAYYMGQDHDAYKNELCVSVALLCSYINSATQYRCFDSITRWALGECNIAIPHDATGAITNRAIALRGVDCFEKMYGIIDNNDVFFVVVPWGFSASLNNALEFEYERHDRDYDMCFIHKDGIDRQYANARYLWKEGDYANRKQYPYSTKLNFPHGFFLLTKGLNFGTINKVEPKAVKKQVKVVGKTPRRKCCP